MGFTSFDDYTGYFTLKKGDKVVLTAVIGAVNFNDIFFESVQVKTKTMDFELEQILSDMSVEGAITGLPTINLPDLAAARSVAKESLPLLKATPDVKYVVVDKYAYSYFPDKAKAPNDFYDKLSATPSGYDWGDVEDGVWMRM